MQFVWYRFVVSLELEIRHSLVVRHDDRGPLLFDLILVGVVGLPGEMTIGGGLILLLWIRLLSGHLVAGWVGTRCGSKVVLIVDECGWSSSCGPG